MEVLEHFYNRTIIPIKIGPVDISITNLVLSMFLSIGVFLTILIIFAAKPKIIPGKRQVVVELFINFIRRNICQSMIGKEGDKWVPLIAGIFIFILANNLMGLVPGVYTTTLNPIVPLTLAVIVFLTVHITNFIKNGFRGYFRTYAPRAVPKWMLVIVVPIEIISAIAKPFSLFIRLMANILAGHTIIFVVLGLITYFRRYLVAVAAVPFAIIMMLLEMLVSSIQAYIFAILSALYIGEAIKPRH